MTALRTMLVGCGRIGTNLGDDPLTREFYQCPTHAQAIAEHEARFKLVAVADVDREAAARAAERWDCGWFGVDPAWFEPPQPHRPFLGDAILGPMRGYAPEVLVLAIPPGNRLAYLRAAWGSIKAVMVEKPLGAEGPELVRWCREHAVTLAVGYQRRAVPEYQALAAGGLADMIGRPIGAHGVFTRGLGGEDEAWDAMGRHLVDLGRMLLGEPCEACPWGVTHLRGAGYRELRLDIWGERGRLVLEHEGLTTRWYRRVGHRAISGQWEPAGFCESDAINHNAWRYEPAQIDRGVGVGAAMWWLYDDFARAIETGTAPCSTGESALATEALAREFRCP